MKRIGVFVCWCGFNISRTVDISAVVEAMRAHPGVVRAQDYKYMCSEPGQNLIKESISKDKLDAVVVAACSPNMHEATFRQAASSAGLNPYMLEVANIREQCSWVHPERDLATKKAIDLIRMMVEKVKRNEPLHPTKIPIKKRALVIGGGIAGMQAALDIADSGYEVVLVERQPHIGGKMAQLSETFPTLDCASCILTPKTAEVGRHPNIILRTYSEVVEVSGYVGNFKAKIRRKPAYVDWSKCIGCMDCMSRCPKKVPSSFDGGLGLTKAISVAFPQAVPYRPVIDRSSCIYFDKGRCGVCAKVCPVGAIDFEQKEEFFEEEVGAIVVATGFDLMPKSQIKEYGAGRIKDVIDGLQFERLNSSSGPTEGQIRRPSDGKVPKEVVFIQCVGSRDTEQGKPYCSKICCMYTAKHAMLYKHKVPDGQAYVFYMDIRAGGKGYEEFVQRGIEHEGTLYLRGRVSKLYEEDGKVVVLGTDTLSGKNIKVAADMVVLAMAAVPSSGVESLAQALKVNLDEHGFVSEAHPKLRPVESPTRGVYLSGAAHGPKDIPESVSQASGAASKVLSLFSRDELVSEPLIASPDESSCTGCLWCKAVCPYQAIDEKFIEERVRGKTVRRRVASVNAGLCQGCGACTVACRSGAMNLKGFTNHQILAEVEALCL